MHISFPPVIFFHAFHDGLNNKLSLIERQIMLDLSFKLRRILFWNKQAALSFGLFGEHTLH